MSELTSPAASAARHHALQHWPPELSTAELAAASCLLQGGHEKGSLVLKLLATR